MTKDLAEQMTKYELKLYFVTFRHKGNRQTLDFLVWACDPDDAWSLVKEGMGEGVEQLRTAGMVAIEVVDPQRGILSSSAGFRRRMTDTELQMEADDWDTGRKNPPHEGRQQKPTD